MCTDQEKELTGVETTVENPSPPETRPTEEKKEYENFAFISYSHRDKRLAKWLQRKLEAYRFPSTVRKENKSLPRKISPVFRDETDLYGTELIPSIFQQLDESQFLIVICSPNSAQSVYVNQEVAYFNSLGRHNRIIPFIIKGSPDATSGAECCYCPALLDPKTNSLLAINANELSRRNALIKLIATMMDLRPDSLIHREKVRRRKRLIASLVAIMVLIVAVAVSFKFIMGPERSAALAKESTAALNRGSVFEAIDKGKESVKNLLRAQEGDNGVVALRSALAAQELSDTDESLHQVFCITTLGRNLRWLGNSQDDSVLFLYNAQKKEIVSYNNQTGVEIDTMSLSDFSGSNNPLQRDLTAEIDEYGYLHSGTDAQIERKQAHQRHSLRFVNETTLIVSDGISEKRFSDIDAEEYCYCFNKNERIFAVSNSYTDSITAIDLKTGSEWKISFPYSQYVVYSLQLSAKGRLLFINYWNNDEDECYSAVYDLCRNDWVTLMNITTRVAYISLANMLEHKIQITDEMEDYFYVFDQTGFYKYVYADQYPGQIISSVFRQPDSTKDTAWENACFSEDNAVCSACRHDFVKQEKLGTLIQRYFFAPDSNQALLSVHYGFYREPNKYIENYTYDATQKEIWYFSDTPRVLYDQNMTTLALSNGEIWDIRNAERIYTENADRLHWAAIDRDGRRIAAIDDACNVYLYTIDQGYVEKKLLTSMCSYLGGNYSGDDLNDCIANGVSISEEYVIISAFDAIYLLSTEDGSVYVEKNGFDGYEECQLCFEKDGLLFMNGLLYGRGSGLIIYDPKQHKKLELGESTTGYAADYHEETHLFCDFTNDYMMHNPEIIVYKNNNGDFKKLYSMEADADSVQFSRDGKYLILHASSGGSARRSTVLDAQTGEVLLELSDRLIAIIDDTIYDVSVPYVPMPLPQAHLYTADELKKIAKK